MLAWKGLVRWALIGNEIEEMQENQNLTETAMSWLFSIVLSKTRRGVTMVFLAFDSNNEIEIPWLSLQSKGEYESGFPGLTLIQIVNEIEEMQENQNLTEIATDVDELIIQYCACKTRRSVTMNCWSYSGINIIFGVFPVASCLLRGYVY